MSADLWYNADMKMTCLTMAAVAAGLTATADVVGTVNFNEEVGRVRPELHSSGLTPRRSTARLAEIREPNQCILAPV